MHQNTDFKGMIHETTDWQDTNSKGMMLLNKLRASHWEPRKAPTERRC